MDYFNKGPLFFEVCYTFSVNESPVFRATSNLIWIGIDYNPLHQFKNTEKETRLKNNSTQMHIKKTALTNSKSNQE